MAHLAEQVDARDLKFRDREIVPVRVREWVPALDHKIEFSSIGAHNSIPRTIYGRDVVSCCAPHEIIYSLDILILEALVDPPRNLHLRINDLVVLKEYGINFNEKPITPKFLLGMEKLFQQNNDLFEMMRKRGSSKKFAEKLIEAAISITKNMSRMISLGVSRELYSIVFFNMVEGTLLKVMGGLPND